MSSVSQYVCRKGPVFHAVQRTLAERAAQPVEKKPERVVIERPVKPFLSEYDRRQMEKTAALERAIIEAAEKPLLPDYTPATAGGYAQGHRPGLVTMRAVQRAVCQTFDVTLKQLNGDSRTSGVCLARHLAIWLCHKHTMRSNSDLGRCFERDHSSILHAIRRIEKRKDELSSTISTIRGKLGVEG
jgi:chromosomal replication initiation ATPase DnaA